MNWPVYRTKMYDGGGSLGDFEDFLEKLHCEFRAYGVFEHAVEGKECTPITQDEEEAKLVKRLNEIKTLELDAARVEIDFWYAVRDYRDANLTSLHSPGVTTAGIYLSAQRRATAVRLEIAANYQRLGLDAALAREDPETLQADQSCRVIQEGLRCLPPKPMEEMTQEERETLVRANMAMEDSVAEARRVFKRLESAAEVKRLEKYESAMVLIKKAVKDKNREFVRRDELSMHILKECLGENPRIVVDPLLLDPTLTEYQRGYKMYEALLGEYGQKAADSEHRATEQIVTKEFTKVKPLVELENDMNRLFRVYKNCAGKEYSDAGKLGAFQEALRRNKALAKKYEVPLAYADREDEDWPNFLKGLRKAEVKARSLEVHDLEKKSKHDKKTAAPVYKGDTATAASKAAVKTDTSAQRSQPKNPLRRSQPRTRKSPSLVSAGIMVLHAQ